MLEFDVALTKDHRVVLMHDTTVDRTTTGSGRVSDFTLDELKQLDAGSWKGKAFAGARVPRLSEVLAMVPQNIWLNVHLKGDRLLAEKTAGELRDSDRLHQSFLACDNQSAQAAKDIVPSIQICNMERQAESDLYAENTLQQGTEFIQLLSRRPKSLAHIPRLRQHRVKINFCCTNQREQLSELLARGVDFVLVEEVKPMVAQAETLGIQRLKPKYAKD
jgi:glycerophosphoryl diester phosphodiesterase